MSHVFGHFGLLACCFLSDRTQYWSHRRITLSTFPFVGYLLRLFGACPWNYEAYEWDFLGLICLEYAPLWYLASLAYDRILLHYTLHLQWKPARTVGRSKSQ